MRKTRTEYPCAVCGKLVERQPKQIKKSATVYCSRPCYWSAMRAKPDAERFWSKVNQDGPVHPVLGTPCWLWTGATTVAGYGYLSTAKQERRYAHRVSWELVGCADAAGKDVCHKCDNPPCVNPDHLFLGTHGDNVRDMTAKGRGKRTLCAADVLAIRAEYSHDGSGRNRSPTNQYRLAERYGVAQTTIGAILRRETWRHV